LFTGPVAGLGLTCSDIATVRLSLTHWLQLAGEIYASETITRVTGVIAAILACALPTAGIGILAIVHSLAVRIVLVGVFSMLLSVTLILLTNCTRVEIFMATAA
jgi:hypothetical protein